MKSRYNLSPRGGGQLLKAGLACGNWPGVKHKTAPESVSGEFQASSDE